MGDKQYQTTPCRIINHFVSIALVSSLTLSFFEFFFISFRPKLHLLSSSLYWWTFSLFSFFGGPTDCLVTMFNSSGAFLHSSLPLCHCEGQNLSGCSTCTLNKAFFYFFHPQAQRIIPHECLLSQRNTRSQKYFKWGVWWLSG